MTWRTAGRLLFMKAVLMRKPEALQRKQCSLSWISKHEFKFIFESQHHFLAM